jgi:hypothetical protein
MQYSERCGISQMSTTDATDGISKLLLDEADGKVGKRKRNKENSFVVFEGHYKYGEYSVSSFDTEEDLRVHLEREIASYRATLGDRDSTELGGEDKDEAGVENTDKLSLSELVEKATELGQRILNQQAGYGIVSVVCGEVV